MNGNCNCPGIPRRIVRFADDVVAREDASFDIANPPRGAAGGALLRELVVATPGLRYSRVFSTLEPDELDKLVARAQDRTKGAYKPPNFLACYFADPVPGNQAGEFDRVIRSARFEKIVRHLRESLPGRPPSAVTPDDDPYWPVQYHFHPAPKGTDAEAAWKHASLGGTGEGLNFADVEVGYPVNHTDLPNAKIQKKGPPGPVTAYYADHATAVVGIICALDNAQGGIGGAPNVNQVLMCSNVVGGQIATADAIARAVRHLNEGDVLLIEHQQEITVDDPISGAPITVGIPAEYDHDVYDAISLATASGIIVVEAGGNGDEGVVPVDFDQLKVDDGSPFDESQDARKSDAIIVSAAQWEMVQKGNLRLPCAPYGNRVDCYARGVGVTTTRVGGDARASNRVSESFGGTSAAAAIIAATALQVQGLAKAQQGAPLTPAQMRSVFRDATLGTAPVAEAVPRPIGSMPDLKKIIDRLDTVSLP